MKKVKVVKITKQEKEALINGYNLDNNPSFTLEELLKTNENQTLSILRQIKNIYEWKDIEDMVNYVDVIKKFENNQKDSSIDIENNEHKLVIKVFKEAVKSGKVNGHGAEKLAEVYNEFVNAI